jgi:hypothetical protein
MIFRRRLMARSDHRRQAGGAELEVDLFSHIQSVIYLNPEISDGAFQLRVPEKQLHCAQVAGFAIDLCGLCAPH